MRWYDLILGCEAHEQPFVSDRHDLRGRENWQLEQGQPIENWDSGAWIKCTKEETNGPPDDGLWNHLHLPIFSSRMQRALTRGGIDCIQYLPIRVLQPDDGEYSGYAIANIVNLVSALNTDRSDFSLYPNDYFIPARRGQIFSIRKAVLRKDHLNGFHAMRLKEFDVAAYVSQRFVDICEQNRFTGYSFSAVETT